MKLNLFQKKVFAFIMLVSCINLFIGCHRYYRPVIINTPTVEKKQATVRSLSSEDRYFILRKGNNSYSLNNILLDESKMTLTANISSLPRQHQLYTYKRPNLRFSIAKNQQVVLKEVHLFVGDTAAIADTTQRYTLALSDVQKIAVLEFDKGRTTRSYVLGAFGITLGAGLVVLIIAAATYTPAPQPTTVNGSCPYISSAVNGKKFSLQGEIYSGAIYPSLQREDYLPLQLEANKGVYCIKINNELKEIQYTDFADLVIAEHDQNVRLLIDPQGKIHSISKPQLPLTALLNNKTDESENLKYEDYRSCLFKDGAGNQNQQDLYLTFRNDRHKTNGKLILKARSSPWFNHVYNEFTKGFGSYYKTWVKEQEKRPASELDKWADEQHIPLTVSVKNATGWKEINKLRTIGPLLNREVVIPLDIPSTDITEVKVSGGYMFWELDYAAIDYSDDANFSVKEIKPYEAINEKGHNVLPELSFADRKFMLQPEVGDSTILKYKSIEPHTGKAQTFFFHTSGYYNHPREHTGMPKVAFLKSFSQPGALSAFSKQIFSETLSRFEVAKN